MTINEYIDELLANNFQLKAGDPIPWQVLAAAYVAGKTSDFIIERTRKIISRIIHREFEDDILRMMLDLEPEEIEPIIREREEHLKMNQD